MSISDYNKSSNIEVKKSSKKGDVFKATPGMKIFAFARAEAGDNVSTASICRDINIGENTASNWKKRDGFEGWLEIEVARYRRPINKLLEQVAIDKIDKDYRYWEALARKYGYITDRPEQSDAEKSKLVINFPKQEVA